MGEAVGVLAAREVQPVHLPVVPPLMERRRRLVVLEALEDRAVDHHLDGETVSICDVSKAPRGIGVELSKHRWTTGSFLTLFLDTGAGSSILYSIWRLQLFLAECSR